ncbi:MAG: UDP-N-acetylmuramoyl-tripeptide--D-alanyl-D-alanine ligase [Deltaproteobacteria bacterium]|jgi:UDP-N-acetylmuramoyl-tripeptide--D-alanyl-D-alanine ligase|nr:UDP-N-acetylmuramoyl-tripeptide--D-alanyl-D-alanine ligase [Deltaproteobacteria bacterium]
MERQPGLHSLGLTVGELISSLGGLVEEPRLYHEGCRISQKDAHVVGNLRPISPIGHIPSTVLESKVESVSTDTRNITKGSLFVGLRGPRFNGGLYASEALSKGALFAVVESSCQDALMKQSLFQEQDARGKLLFVSDALTALGLMANLVRRRQGLRVCAVTGSVGKTTVKELIASILREEYGSERVLATLGNLNNLVGLPLTLFQADSHHSHAVLEMGANAFGEIRALSKISEPDVALITRIGKAHLEGFGDLQGVARAKLELFQALSVTGVAVVNQEDPFLKDISTKATKVGFGGESAYRVLPEGPSHKQAPNNGPKNGQLNVYQRDQVKALNKDFKDNSGTWHLGEKKHCHKDSFKESLFDKTNIRLKGKTVTLYQEMTLAGPGFPPEGLPVRLRLLGAHNRENALAAAAAAVAMGATPVSVQRGLEMATAPPGRGVLIKEELSGVYFLDESYNSNPSSMDKALSNLSCLSKALKSKNLHAIIGSMLELGEDSVKEHYTLGRRLCECRVKSLSLVGVHSDSVKRGFLSSGCKESHLEVFTDPLKALSFTLAMASPGDLVLLKGSHSTGISAIGEALAGK